MARRTTVTLDDDVAAKLDHQVRNSGEPFRQVLNEALRRGLDSTAPRPKKRFRVRARNLGVVPGVDFDCISRLLDEVEGPERK